MSAEIQEAQDGYNDTGAMPYKLRTPDEITSFFDGLDLVEPGVVPCPRWRPDDSVDTPLDIDAFGGVGRKPGHRHAHVVRRSEEGCSRGAGRARRVECRTITRYRAGSRAATRTGGDRKAS